MLRELDVGCPPPVGATGPSTSYLVKKTEVKREEANGGDSRRTSGLEAVPGTEGGALRDKRENPDLHRSGLTDQARGHATEHETEPSSSARDPQP